ncbi:ATP-binding protein [Cytophagaceae bacterium ABcell3]|nr:ATP-binding protein [Cytophagaceae bacterium ABcell3]
MVKNLIREGEGETLDFKHTISSAKKIAKSLVAFANTHGGKILVGVKDNGSVVGATAEEERYMLEGAAALECKPPVKVEFCEEIINGKTILVAEIPESHNKPHYAKDSDGRWWAYIRVKDQCLMASKIMLDVMRNESKGKSPTITFGTPEKILLKYLEENNQITLKGFCKLAYIPRWKASRILVNMIRMKVIRVNASEKLEYYCIY